MLGLIIGNGDLPIRLMEHLETQSTPFCVVNLVDRSIETSAPAMTIQIGEIGKILKFFKSHNTTDIVMIGGIQRPRFGSMKVDATGAKWLAKLGLATLGGDDQLLRRVTELLQAEGFTLQRADAYMPGILVSESFQTKQQPSTIEMLDIEKGIQILKALSPHDVGQAIIIENGIVLGVEAAEGTKQLIQRCAPLKQQATGGVLIKMAKINQLETADLPTIGPETIQDLIRLRYRGLAVERDRVQVVDGEACLKHAEAANFVIYAI